MARHECKERDFEDKLVEAEIVSTKEKITTTIPFSNASLTVQARRRGWDNILK
jgi:hypothetical protein